MKVFEIVIAMLLVGAALAAVARRVGAPYPAFVALAGAALALIPGVPTLVLDPELALTLFVAPVLIDAAFDSSMRDLRRNWRPIAGLALGAVLLTVAVVAIVARLLVPDISWAAAIALGAIVAPPDAAAATTVLRSLRPPNRLMVILEGESLFNDASALLIYRLAVGATVSGMISGWTVVPTLLVVTLGSVVLALVLSRLMLLVIRRITDLPTAVIVQFCSAFLVWMLAERLHLSGIITVVVFAMAASRHAPAIMPARLRIPTFAFWEVAVFVLNVLAFILVGFQLKSITGRMSAETWPGVLGVAAAVIVAVILARFAWVLAAAAVSRHWARSTAHEKHSVGVALTSRAAVVVGWCGMRGTVTLAAALALPTDFPHRDLILTTAFAVTLATLVIQGLTLRPLMLWLKLEDEGSVEREIRLARVESLRAAVAAATAHSGTEPARLILSRYQLQLQHAEIAASGGQLTALEPVAEDGREAEALAVQAALTAQRERLLALRSQGTIGDAAFQKVEEELDWMELGWAQVLPPKAEKNR